MRRIGLMQGEMWLDEPATGSWNMARDQAILERAAQTQRIQLRVYRWSHPTLSLGYFQEYDRLAAYPELAGLDCVRRSTGGGAILHHRELTYSLAIPANRDGKGHSDPLYRAVHRAVIEWLGSLGATVQFWEDTVGDGATSPDDRAFLCFERRSAVDLVIGQSKILGSAQRRTANGLLQHGSLLLEASPFLPRLGGIAEETAGKTLPEGVGGSSAKIFGDVLMKALQRQVDGGWEEGHSLSSLDARTRVIEAETYGSIRWTRFK